MAPKFAERSEFSGPHRGNALYQGTTSVGPLRPNKDLGLYNSPGFLSFPGEGSRG